MWLMPMSTRAAMPISYADARSRVESLFHAPSTDYPPADGFQAWRSRPLPPRYAVLFFDSLPVKVKERGLLRNKRIHLVLGIMEDGNKDILACWDAPLGPLAIQQLRARGMDHFDLGVVEQAATTAALKTSFPAGRLCIQSNALSLADLPPALKQLCSTTSAAESLIEKRRRRGLTKPYTFANMEAAMRDLVFVLQDANSSWKVSPRRWAEVRQELLAWRPQAWPMP